MRRFVSAAVAACLAASPVWAQGQPPTEVEPLESRAAMVPVPNVGEGAPYYSPEQLQGEISQAENNRTCITGSLPGKADRKLMELKAELISAETRVRSTAAKARDATAAAEDARRRASAGESDMAEVERTELARQAAVRAYDHAIFKDGMLGYDPVIDPDPPIALEQVTASIDEGEKGDLLRVSGVIRNVKPHGIKIPVVTLTMFDVRGNLTYATALQPLGPRLKAGESRPFAFRMPNRDEAASLEVTPGEHAAFGGRDFCTGERDDGMFAALSFWAGQRQRAFIRPPPPRKSRSLP